MVAGGRRGVHALRVDRPLQKQANVSQKERMIQDSVNAERAEL